MAWYCKVSFPDEVPDYCGVYAIDETKCSSPFPFGWGWGIFLVLYKRGCCSIDDIGFCFKRKFPIESQLKNDPNHHFL